MGKTTAEYRRLAGTRASVGRAGAHSVIADRPEGKSGGMGLGFNGGELLALTIGGCFANDLRYQAQALDLKIGVIAIAVTVAIEGDPLLCTAAEMKVHVEMDDGSDPQELIERTRAITMAANSLRKGFPVNIVRG